MAFMDLTLLGVKVEENYFIDCALPFEASISCKIFEDVASLIHWIAEKRAGHKFLMTSSQCTDSTWSATTLCLCLSQYALKLACQCLQTNWKA